MLNAESTLTHMHLNMCILMVLLVAFKFEDGHGLQRHMHAFCLFDLIHVDWTEQACMMFASQSSLVSKHDCCAATGELLSIASKLGFLYDWFFMLQISSKNTCLNEQLL